MSDNLKKNPELDQDIIIVFKHDGSIRVGWDTTKDQLRAVRDTVIPVLLGLVTANREQKGFTTYTFPPKE